MTFIIGAAAVFCGVLIFCGSVWMLLTLVLGSRLAYYITASITLAFILIMGAVWSFGTQPLGPVSEQPSWNPVGIGESAADVNFGPASQYPEAPWAPAPEDDDAKKAQAAELQSAATDYLQEQIDEGKIDLFDTASDAVVAEDSALLIENDGKEYGAVMLEPGVDKKGGDLFVVMSYDPGNPFQMARFITIGSGLLLILHLFGLSRAESAARRRAEAIA
jgi:hypothetical protein